MFRRIVESDRLDLPLDLSPKSIGFRRIEISEIAVGGINRIHPVFEAVIIRSDSIDRLERAQERDVS